MSLASQITDECKKKLADGASSSAQPQQGQQLNGDVQLEILQSCRRQEQIVSAMYMLLKQLIDQLSTLCAPYVHLHQPNTGTALVTAPYVHQPSTGTASVNAPCVHQPSTGTGVLSAPYAVVEPNSTETLHVLTAPVAQPPANTCTAPPNSSLLTCEDSFHALQVDAPVGATCDTPDDMDEMS